MANQWGRDSQISARPKERGLLIPMVISMAFGAAVSFGVFDYLQSGKVPQEQLLEAKTKISDLEQKLFVLKGEVEAAQSQPKTDPSIANTLSDLQAQKQQLQNELDATTNKLSTLSNAMAERDAAQSKLRATEAENAQLKSDIKSLSDTANKGNDVAGQRVAQLEQANRQLASDLLALQDSSSATVKSLNGKIDNLQNVDLANAVAKQKKLSDDLNQLKAAKSASETVLNTQVADLKQQLAATEATNKTLQSKLDDSLKSAASASDAKAKAQEDKIASLQADVSKARAELTDTQKQLSEANAKLAAAAQPKATEQPATTPPAATATLKTRDPGQVDGFLSTATGFRSLTDAQKAELKTHLVQGDCVADSLKTVIGHVPVLMLRDLIRDLKSDC